MTDYFAHSTPDASRGDWQRLDRHLVDTAALAELFGGPIGIGAASRLAALLHDVGKYTAAFQRRLSGGKEPVDHSTAGAAAVMDFAKSLKPQDRIVCELIAYSIAGHHAGLPDKQGDGASTLSRRLADFGSPPDPVWKTEIALEAKSLLPDLCWEPRDRTRFAFQLGFLGRMIFSCLVDADFKDTEQFYAKVEGKPIDRDWVQLKTLLPGLIDRFDSHMGRIARADTQVNRLRTEILAHVRSGAARKPGLFTLTVPTGGGKTLASLGFALDHARAHGLRRIIYAIPFTSIIDQTAAIFEAVLGRGIVLEHHSAIEDEEGGRPTPRDADSRRADRDKLRLAMEDWAAPVVVTTNVQLFESLFAARTGRARKLHNIAGSVIVLDEAQTLPQPLLIPTLWALRELADNYGCSIVLCTATQPALDAARFKPGHPAAVLDLKDRELAPDPAALAAQLKRVTIRHAGRLDDDAVVMALRETAQALVIVNSRRHALALYKLAKAEGLDGMVHLTTRQVAAHRRVILGDIRAWLKDGRPCRVIATSLVEAGVDLDFPLVWRAEAGLDQILQAAGRCNREGTRPPEDSIVTVFAPAENEPPPEIKALRDAFERIRPKHDDLLLPKAVEDYFEDVFWQKGIEGLDKGRVDGQPIRDKFAIGANETSFAYRSAAENYRLIESGMAPVIVAWNDEAREAVRDLSSGFVSSGAIARRLQTYVVQIPPKARQRLIECGHVSFRDRALRDEQFAVLETAELYSNEVGLVWEDGEYMKQESWII